MLIVVAATTSCPFRTKNLMLCAAIPHCGQLNITTSILDRVVALCHSSTKSVGVCSRSNWLAHVLLLKLRVGVQPSNKTLEVTISQLIIVVIPLCCASEHCPVEDDPFTSSTSPEKIEYLSGFLISVQH